MLEKEKDAIKRMKLSLKIQLLTEKILIHEIKSLSESKFDRLMDELLEPIAQQKGTTMKKMDSFVFKTSEDPEEFEKYKKIKKIQEQHGRKIVRTLDDANLGKNALKRYLTLVLMTQIQNDLVTANNVLEYSEFVQGARIVHERLGFDDKWLICMSLIQLHENLVKKKIILLGGTIKGDEPMNVLILRLTELIKKNEKRDVGLVLQMSSGLKKIRDIMTHDGYKHNVAKEDLVIIIEEIKRLENILYSKSENSSTSQ